MLKSPNRERQARNNTEIKRQNGTEIAAALSGAYCPFSCESGSIFHAPCRGFQVRPLAGADHPNTVELDLTAADGARLSLVARSIGGGEVEITRVQGRPVLFNGSAYESLVEVSADQAGAACSLLTSDGQA